MSRLMPVPARFARPLLPSACSPCSPPPPPAPATTRPPRPRGGAVPFGGGRGGRPRVLGRPRVPGRRGGGPAAGRGQGEPGGAAGADRPAAGGGLAAGDDPVPAVRRATGGAAKSGSTAVLVAYNVPHRDCGQHSAGGAADRAAYGEWIDAFASAIGESKAVVVLEPDAVPHMVDGCTPPSTTGSAPR
ncbi:glycoside hydrolase family 6 protein [Actinomadura keratinilytica]